MTTDSYSFCGNRAYVLEAMLAAGLDIASIAVVAGSYAEKFCNEKNISHTSVAGRQDFLQWLGLVHSNLFIANGYPYKVPVAEFPNIKFINIHPSYLPELRGADPIPGAILFARDSGATCHLMDASLDTGDIIAQTRLPYSPDWDALTLYPRCFTLEAEIFKAALARDFQPLHPQKNSGNEIYYSFKPEDLQIQEHEDAQAVLRRVHAFNTPNKLARFIKDGREYKITKAEIVPSSTSATENELVIQKGGTALRLQISKP